VISGSGKIAMHVLEKLLPCGAIPITVSGIQTKGFFVLITQDIHGLEYHQYYYWHQMCLELGGFIMSTHMCLLLYLSSTYNLTSLMCRS
jgi:hypothetical protein